jgi:hypothetical protein
METADLLCELIRQHRVVELVGPDDPPGHPRVVEPHAVYIGSNDRGFVDFYQRSGWSKSERLPGWRRFALLDVADLRPLDQTFTPRGDYRPDNRRWYRAFVCTADGMDEGGQLAAPSSSESRGESGVEPG